MEGGGDRPPALLTQNRVDVSGDLDFQRVWMYLNGFAAGVLPDELTETSEQYLGYFGVEATFSIPPKIREALKPLKQVLKDRQEVFSGEKEALEVIACYTKALKTKPETAICIRVRPEAVKRTLQQAGFSVEDDKQEGWWCIDFNNPKRARK